MARFSVNSLRVKLQLFAFLLVLVPGVLSALIALARARAALEQAVGRQLAEVAHDVLVEVNSSLAAERRNVRTWARQDIMRDVVIGDLDKRITRFLRSLVDGGAPYLDLVCADRTGHVVATTDPAWLEQTLADRPWAGIVLAGGESVLGPIGGPPGARTAVEIAVPIFDPERSSAVIGALLGRYDWAHAMGLADRIRKTLVPHGLRVDVTVFDGNGAAIGEAWQEGLTPAAVSELEAAGTRVIRSLPVGRRRGYVTEREAGVLVGYERGEGTETWLALVMQPLAAAFAPVRQLQGRLLLTLGAVLMGALGMATFLAARMSRPLRELARATREIARVGAPPRPVSVRSRDEIGQLAADFNAMAAELTRAQEDLLVAAKFAFVGEVAAGVAHEIRTPLGILRSSAQMLRRTLPVDQPESSELAQMIVEEVDRLDHVVDGLLELARPREPLIEPTPLAPVLARALDFVEGQAREKGIILRRALDMDHGWARCDPEQVYRVALNLIVNALQILPREGTISVRTLPRRDDTVGFEVIDDGPGIPPEFLERIFTPFFTRRPGGTGLGLALVQRMVQAHQGTVTVESTVGRGTTFRVEFPAAGERR